MRKLLIPIFFFLLACSGENQNAISVEKNSELVDQNEIDLSEEPKVTGSGRNYLPANKDFSRFEIQPNQKQVIHTKTGSTIEIPANTLEFQDGSPTTGKATILFREYHTAGEIICSGIPMVWDSAGKAIQFESAGMFEIQAESNGKPLKVKDGKKIKVDIASRHKGKFHFFNFDQGISNWNILKTDIAEKPNTAKKERIAKADSKLNVITKPKKPATPNQNATNFDISINPDVFPDYKDLNGIIWQYDGNDPQQNPATNPDFAKKTWNVVKIVPDTTIETLCYNITLRAKDSAEFTTRAQPVYQGKILDKKNKEFYAKLEKFNKEVADLTLERERAAEEYDFIRSMEIEGMGIYNYDRQFKEDGALQLVATFDFGRTIDLKKNPLTVFLVSGNDNVVIKYTPDSFELFAYFPNKNNKLIAFLPNGISVGFSNKDFEAIPFAQLSNGSPWTFKLKDLKPAPQSSKDVDDGLATL